MVTKRIAMAQKVAGSVGLTWNNRPFRRRVRARGSGETDGDTGQRQAQAITP
jgi:hypothetical protein